MSKLLNTDGDPMQPTTIFYQLHCTPREALDALISLSMEGVDDYIYSGQFDDQGNLQAIDIPWFKTGNKMHKSWDNTVLGHLRIDTDQLIVEVNSQQRAEAVKRKITRRLGKRAVYRHAVIESVEKLLEDVKPESAAKRPVPTQADDERMKTPEAQAVIKTWAKNHWRDWLGVPLPASQGKSPRQAAGSVSGCERLETLLMQFERRDRDPEPFDPDVDALRRALGQR